MNSIIPIKGFPQRKGSIVDKEAIAFWISTGFFFKDDSFWKDVKWNDLDFQKSRWNYNPRSISLQQAVEEFKEIFENSIKEEIGKRKPLLALSGGLDSRTLAVALKNLEITPYCYSYRFEDSFNETKYGKRIAETYNWDFEDLIIPRGYLWKHLEEAAKINFCYSEFTHARQVAVVDQLADKGDIWLLGHWGDVLFDDMGVDSSLNFDNQISILKKKVIKKGGLELATDLWASWKIGGDFGEALEARIKKMHELIPINDANARIRAFKSSYWATRWTTTNLSYFKTLKPIVLPYYDDRMCEFIMTIPEKWLAARQIQIEYIKKYAPELARIEWQSKAPYNLFNYDKHLTVTHLPYRIMQKIKSTYKARISRNPIIERNWEIQFLGKENDKHLQFWLFENPEFTQLVPKEIIEKYYQLFKKGDKIYWSHPISMLLTLSVFSKQNEIKISN